MPSIEYQIEEIAGILKGDIVQKKAKLSIIKDILIDSRRLISPEQWACARYSLSKFFMRHFGHQNSMELQENHEFRK